MGGEHKDEQRKENKNRKTRFSYPGLSRRVGGCVLILSGGAHIAIGSPIPIHGKRPQIRSQIIVHERSGRVGPIQGIQLAQRFVGGT